MNGKPQPLIMHFFIPQAASCHQLLIHATVLGITSVSQTCMGNLKNSSYICYKSIKSQEEIISKNQTLNSGIQKLVLSCQQDVPTYRRVHHIVMYSPYTFYALYVTMRCGRRYFGVIYTAMCTWPVHMEKSIIVWNSLSKTTWRTNYKYLICFSYP